MQFWPEDASIFTIIKDSLIAGAALATALIAACGVSTWRRKLRGKTEHEAAHRILVCSYALRDAITRQRWAVWWAESPERVVAEDVWKPLWTAKAELEASLMEGEALWGKSAREAANSLLGCVNNLWEQARLHWVHRDDQEWLDSDEGENAKSVCSSNQDAQEDSFRKEVLDAVAEIEKLVKPRL
jgi:hypothetical protein